MIKVGLKIFTTDEPKILEERSFADYFEVYPVPGISAGWLKDYDHEYIIHAPHASHGVNLASKKLQASSLKTITEALGVADLLDAKIVVLHAGNTKSRAGESDMETLKDSLSRLDDKRLILENLPCRTGFQHFFAYDYATTKELSARFSNRICLDFSHAMVTSAVQKKGYKELISELLKLDVRLFHMTDGRQEIADDLHLPLFEGNLDLGYFKGIVEKSACRRVTLETPINLAAQRKEYDWLKR
jgi:deoxyribonuclease IV